MTERVSPTTRRLAASLVEELLALPDEALRPLADRLAPFLTSDGPDTVFLSVAQAAERLEVHPNTVYRMILRGRLHATRAGRLWRIPEGELGRANPTSRADPRPPTRGRRPASSGRFVRLVRELPYAGAES